MGSQTPSRPGRSLLMRLVPWRGARLDSLEETEDLGHAHIPVTLKHPQALASPHSHPGFLGTSFGVPGSIFNHFPSVTSLLGGIISPAQFSTIEGIAKRGAS